MHEKEERGRNTHRERESVARTIALMDLDPDPWAMISTIRDERFKDSYAYRYINTFIRIHRYRQRHTHLIRNMLKRIGTG